MTISRRDFGILAGGVSAGLAGPAVWTGARAQGQPIRIGCTVSQTGALASTKNALIGYELWRDDINAAGGLLGRKVELVVYDDQSAPAQVPSIYSKLIDVDKVDFLFSPYGANLTATMMPLAKQRDRCSDKQQDCRPAAQSASPAAKHRRDHHQHQRADGENDLGKDGGEVHQWASVEWAWAGAGLPAVRCASPGGLARSTRSSRRPTSARIGRRKLSG